MAEEENEVQEVDVGNSPAPSSQKNPFVALLLVLNLVAMGTIAFFQYKFMEMEAKRPDLATLLKESQAGADAEIAEEEQPKEEISKESLFELETFTVNLAQGDGPRRYVRLNTVLKLSEDTEFSEVEARKPQIRDTIINILNSKRPEDLLRREGKFNLKQEIKSAINSFLIDGKVTDVFYVGFQIN
jgi:flagellar FliL protein